MTQHLYPATDADGNQVEIMVGWDRPLHEVFANVFPVMPDGTPDDIPVISTMAEGFGRGMEADELEQWLEEKGFQMPEPVYLALADDIEFNRGNIVTRYDEQGNIQLPASSH
jgi:hypothetical protein